MSIPSAVSRTTRRSRIIKNKDLSDIMDKEIANIQEIQKYIGTKVGIKHLSNSYSLFNSGVIYEDPKHGDLILENVQMRWQHSFNNDISIAELRPPY